MKHIFSETGKAALREVMSRHPLLAFDFDGTLAPIVPLPDAAATPASISRRLTVLADQLPIAIITGRTVADVCARLGFQPHYVLGSHGAEGWSGVDMAPAAQLMDPLRVFLEARAPELRQLGVRVEDKHLSLALHYRSAPDREKAMAFIHELLRESTAGLVVFGGKCVVNVVPANAPNKGHALQALVQQTGVDTVVFIGDDLNDEAAFSIALPHWLTIRVGGPDASSSARYFIEDHKQIAILLQFMTDLLAA